MGPFHGSSESHASFNLKRDVLSHELGIDFRFADFLNIDENFLGNEIFQVLLEKFDLRTFFADYDSGSGCKNAQPNAFCRSFNFDL